MTRRVIHLLLGLPLYGAGCAFTVGAGLGVDPWTVLAEGISLRSGIGVGWVVNILGLGVMLLWLPLRQRPGIGTVANILLVGTSMQLVLMILPPVTGLLPRFLLLGAGILAVAVASGLYLGAGFGAGPRDGLMTGIRARFGWPIWLARGSVEITVLAIGWALGGTVGIGTIAFALSIGPLVHLMMPILAIRPRPAGDGAPEGPRRARHPRAPRRSLPQSRLHDHR
jgi:uncharacterized membrane protein YczE